MKGYGELSVKEVLKSQTQLLSEAGINDAQRIAQMILEKVTGDRFVDLWLDNSRPISKSEMMEIESLVGRRLAGEPVQYILGETEFYGLKIKVDRRALIPRPETEVLVETALEWLKQSKGALVLEIGVGSGAIAIALARNSDCRVIAFDCSQEALQLAKENCVINRVKDKVLLVRIDYRTVDLSKVFRERFNLIVANPPYVGIEEFQALESQIKDYEPYWALTDGADGLEFYRRMSPLMPDLLSENGAVFFEVTPNRAKQVEAILKGVLSDFAIIQDYAGLPRVAGGRCSLK